EAEAAADEAAPDAETGEAEAGEGTEEGAESAEGTEPAEESEPTDESAPAAAAPPKKELSDQAWLQRQINALTDEERRPLEMAGVIREPADGPLEFARPAKAGVFFSIYFFMT